MRFFLVLVVASIALRAQESRPESRVAESRPDYQALETLASDIVRHAAHMTAASVRTQEAMSKYAEHKKFGKLFEDEMREQLGEAQKQIAAYEWRNAQLQTTYAIWNVRTDRAAWLRQYGKTTESGSLRIALLGLATIGETDRAFVGVGVCYENVGKNKIKLAAYKLDCLDLLGRSIMPATVEVDDLAPGDVKTTWVGGTTTLFRLDFRKAEYAFDRLQLRITEQQEALEETKR